MPHAADLGDTCFVNRPWCHPRGLQLWKMMMKMMMMLKLSMIGGRVQNGVSR